MSDKFIPSSFSNEKISIYVKQYSKLQFDICSEDGMLVCKWNDIVLGYSETRDGLFEEIKKTILFLWKEYVIDYSKEENSESATRLHDLLLENFEEN